MLAMPHENFLTSPSPPYPAPSSASFSSLSSPHQVSISSSSARPNSTTPIGSRQGFVMMMMPSPPPSPPINPNAHAMLISFSVAPTPSSKDPIRPRSKPPPRSEPPATTNTNNVQGSPKKTRQLVNDSTHHASPHSIPTTLPSSDIFIIPLCFALFCKPLQHLNCTTHQALPQKPQYHLIPLGYLTNPLLQKTWNYPAFNPGTLFLPPPLARLSHSLSQTQGDPPSTTIPPAYIGTYTT
ncbi:hypothetical protein QBC41DRAFT_126493 [Cercophora samala]|uniref:Uncharacterized protein n=1 Tax=Cercophora samala TaxID=330535 RepID=A0AA40DFU4_9PEZI|nr:hypothetical protein QBC41DRAFT_126493 [Cercophora samala]